MELNRLLTLAVEKKASDIFIIAGRPLAFCINNNIENVDDIIQKADDTSALIQEIYKFAKNPNNTFEGLQNTGNGDFSITISGLSRFRISAYRQRGSYAAVIRVISFNMPNYKEIGIPQQVIELYKKKKGMVLVTGSAGSGKSTTLACIIDQINKTQKRHIITLEDPIEYIHNHRESIVTQREIGTDVSDYLTAIRGAMRQRPDVILLGEMRDLETISVALTAAETGHMIYSTLHTIGAANTIDRILDAFPPDQRYQVAIQLSMILEAVVSQQLLPAKDGSMVLATEIMTVTPAIRNLIRDNKIHQLDNVIYSSQDQNMVAMDTSILNLNKQGIITDKVALQYSTNRDMMRKKMGI